MSAKCDHTSVGMVVWRGGRLLLIERRIPPFGFAPPAGHLNGDDSYKKAAIRELEEEVGLKTENIKLLIEGRKNFSCSRPQGAWHYWKIYEVKAEGRLKRSLGETKQAGWYSTDKIKKFSKKTEKYMAGEISKDSWEKSPGIEPVWYEWFSQLGII